MGANGGCGCGAAGTESCRCEQPIAPPDGLPPPEPGAAPAPPQRPAPATPELPRGPIAAPGTQQPYTRFDLFEESRRRGFPVPFPDDPSRPPPMPARAEAERAGAGARPTVLEPFAHPAADGRPIIEPRFDAPARRTPTDGPVVPDGAPLDVERFFDVASPEGVVLPFDIAWPGDSLLSPAGRGLPTPAGGAGKPLPDPLQRARSRSHEPRQPPEYLGSIGGEAERRLLEAPRVEEPKIIDLPPAPVPPGFASPEKPKGKEPRAPGQEACTTDPFYVFPPVEQFLFTPQPPQSRGKGGPPPLTSDPCPCVCKCVPYANTVSAFVLAGRQEEEEQATGKRERRVSSKLPRAFFDMFATDTTTILGVPVQPGLVISTPDGFVEHVRDVVARRDTVGYGAGSSAAPGSVAPLDGLSATFAARQPAPATAPRLLWPELDGTLVAPTRVAAPVGPGPGIPGIGARSLVPASGPPFRSAPGALPAGLAPAGDGFVMDSNGRVS